MAIMIPEPIDSNPMTEDWQKILARTTFQGGGFMQLMISNLNNGEEPKVMPGSRLEVNGTFYVQQDEGGILNPDNMANEQWIFAYARPLTSSLVFEYRNAIPVFDVAKNGWYDPNQRTDRAVAKMYQRDDGRWGKVILDSYRAMAENNFASLPASGGALAARYNQTSAAPAINRLFLNAGAYIFAARGGAGGRGGSSNSGMSWGGANGIGQAGAAAAPALSYNTGNPVQERIGGSVNGAAGGNGGAASGSGQAAGGGGGGGGAAGGTSFARAGDIFMLARGGNGGRGLGSAGSLTEGTDGVTPQPAAISVGLSAATEAVCMQGMGGGNGGNGGNSGNAGNVGSGGGGGTASSANNGFVEIWLLWNSLPPEGAGIA